MSIKRVFTVFIITGKYLKKSFGIDFNAVDVKSGWSQEILSLFNIKVEVKGRPSLTNNSCILVGNHISYLDIPVLMKLVPDISFVSKKEVKFWPVIGRAAVKVKTIFVDRGSVESRVKAKEQIAMALIDKINKIAIFPSGTTSIRRSSFWKKGAFEIAEQNKIEIQPFRFRYEPLSAVAYVGRDNFFFHMLALLKHKELKVILEFHEPILINNSISDCKKWKEWCESVF